MCGKRTEPQKEDESRAERKDGRKILALKIFKLHPKGWSFFEKNHPPGGLAEEKQDS